MKFVAVCYENGPSFVLSREDAERELAKLQRRLALASKPHHRQHLERHLQALERAVGAECDREAGGE